MTANPTLSYVHGMAPMIEINEDATVSRTIMKAETCRVVLFSFDKDQALTPMGRASSSSPGTSCTSAPASPTPSSPWNPARCCC